MRSFNSTMVRLKVTGMRGKRKLVVTFQFHNGSIKSHSDKPTRHRQLKFQFHNGSIKSDFKLDLGGSDRTGFNSTMVRLKVRANLGLRRRMSGFNSTMVRLKESRLVLYRDQHSCFNSTMVRLKAGTSWKRTQTTSRFQFHNGSIKSVALPVLFIPRILVSIPQWFD